MKSTFNLILVCLLGFLTSGLYAQPLNYRYYETGKVYTFRSLDPANSSQTFVLSVRFDEQGRAHVKKTTEQALPGDKTATYAFAANKTLGVSSSRSDAKEIFISDPKASLFEIDFAGGGVLANTGDPIIVSCECTMGNGGCSASAMLGGATTITITCIADAGCSACQLVVTRGGGKIAAPLLLIEATEVIME